MNTARIHRLARPSLLRCLVLPALASLASVGVSGCADAGPMDAVEEASSPLVADAFRRIRGQTGDFTGDRFADYADHDIASGAFFVHANLTNGTFAGVGNNWGTGTTCTVDGGSGSAKTPCDVMVGDFTGDGYADYADHEPSTGLFYVHENLRNGRFAGAGINWGTGRTCTRDASSGKPCAVLVGDFTGDGYADYADREPSTGHFFVHENLRNGRFAGAGINWGTGRTCAGPACEVLGYRR